MIALNPQPQVEREVEELAELRLVEHAQIVSVMCSPPGPLKAESRVWWTERCPSGPFEGDEEQG